jgi:hypothetical protein
MLRGLDSRLRIDCGIISALLGAARSYDAFDVGGTRSEASRRADQPHLGANRIGAG